MTILAPQERVVVPVSDAFSSSYVVKPGGFPGVVSIVDPNSRGSGALLSDGLHILTAAHVVFGETANNLSVFFDLSSGRVEYKVSAINIHPQYIDNNFPAYDIAVLTLASTAPITGYSINRGTSDIGSNFQLVGYGLAGTGLNGEDTTDAGGQEIKRTGSNKYELLYTSTLNIGGFETVPDNSLLFYDFDDGTPARDALNTLAGISNTGLGANEINSARGDSGGPTFINGQIAGVVSGGATYSTDNNGKTDSSFGELSFDTRVSYYASFIDSIVGTTSNGGGSGGGNGSPFPLPLPNPPAKPQTPATTPTTVGSVETGFDVFRFYNTKTQTHFFTTSQNEKDNIIATLSDFNFEGVAYKTADDDYPGVTPVYRFFNTSNGTHFFTSDIGERDNVINNLKQYAYEGEAYDVYGYGVGSAAPVYRFLNTAANTHFYTASEIERENIVNLIPSYKYEGIAWFAEVV